MFLKCITLKRAKMLQNIISRIERALKIDSGYI